MALIVYPAFTGTTLAFGVPRTTANVNGLVTPINNYLDTLDQQNTYSATPAGNPNNLNENQQYAYANASSGNVTITLPLISGLSSTRSFRVKKIDTSANTVTITCNASNLILNPYSQSTPTSITLFYAPGDEFEFIPIGNTWYVSVLRENNAYFSAQAKLASNIANVFGGQQVPLTSIDYDPSNSFSGGFYVPKFNGVWNLSGQITMGPYTANGNQYATAYIDTTSASIPNGGRISGYTHSLQTLSAGNNTVALAVSGQTLQSHTLTSFRFLKDSTNANNDGSIIATSTYMRVSLISRYIP